MAGHFPVPLPDRLIPLIRMCHSAIAVNGKDREIQTWIANTPEASFISLAVHGQSLYRLNYPFRYGRWHHQCTSWNGKTGEWQLWIRGERIGRGFHNRVSIHYE